MPARQFDAMKVKRENIGLLSQDSESNFLDEISALNQLSPQSV